MSRCFQVKKENEEKKVLGVWLDLQDTKEIKVFDMSHVAVVLVIRVLLFYCDGFFLSCMFILSDRRHRQFEKVFNLILYLN